MIISQLKKWFDQPPPGYRPGNTLLYALKDLHGTFNPQLVELSNAVLSNIDDSLALTVSERVERHFKMHIVSLELKLAVTSVIEPGIRVDIRNKGFFSRTGIACTVSEKHREAIKEITVRIIEDPELAQALMILDFRRCRLESSELGWSVMIEPYGASEVVNRMPSFRRYIRMDQRQVQALSQTFTSLQRILSCSADNESNYEVN